jgi:excisionase family DNA binding protein
MSTRRRVVVERRIPRLALSPEEASTALGVSRDYFDAHIAHELRIVRRGRRKLIAVAELERWLERAGALAVGQERPQQQSKWPGAALTAPARHQEASPDARQA